MSNSQSSCRKGNAAVNLLTVMGLFSLVVAVLFFSVETESTDSPSVVAVESTSSSGQDARRSPSDGPRFDRELPDRTEQERTEIVLDEPSAPVRVAEPARQVAEDSSGVAEDVEQRIQAHLDAGEFGLAMDLAASVEDPRMQARLLHQVADAQLDAGEFFGALMAVRQMSDHSEKSAASSDRAVEQSMAGGASGADFGPLMDLILNQTTGPWVDVEGTGGSMSPFGDNTGGISVDPRGLMQQLTREESGNRLALLGRRARSADLNTEMAQPSELRFVSLTRLEREIADRLRQGLPVVETMRNLAGLSSVEILMVLPETGEVVIGGPASPWVYNENGLAIADGGDRPILQLDDLVTLLRTFSRGGAGLFTCSIDPREEGLSRLQSFVSNAGDKPLSPGMVRQRVRHFQDLLGEQDVTIKGIPNDSRVAAVIAEADYRMKLIGIDRLDGGAGIPSFFDLVADNPDQAPASLDALRWWLTMKYDAVLHSADRDVFEIQGSSVQCLSENEFINQQGQRVASGRSETLNREFARNFTENYSELAQRDPVFADLQNVFDLALVAALIDRENLAARADWDHGVFAADGAYPLRRYEAPTTVMSVVNHRVFNGRDVVIQVAGGVRGDLVAVVTDAKIVRADPALKDRKTQIGDAGNGRWWWDAR